MVYLQKVFLQYKIDRMGNTIHWRTLPNSTQQSRQTIWLTERRLRHIGKLFPDIVSSLAQNSRTHNSERYQQLSALRDDITQFSQPIIESFECEPCKTAKTEKAPIRSSPVCRRDLDEEVHFDLSGTIHPTIRGNTYGTHLIKPRSAKSDVELIPQKAHSHPSCKVISPSWKDVSPSKDEKSAA